MALLHGEGGYWAHGVEVSIRGVGPASFRTVAVYLVCVVCGVGASEAMSRVAEAALGEGKDFRWADSEHERGPDCVSKAILTDLVL
ncbi:MAG TPA: hypothetical protein VGW98_08350, partial [Solirubrobacteraceae bacterium]|nr:hypothetical protein [Solirubrobacteraceae bacterium]